MFKYDPKDAVQLLPDGDYETVVLSIEETKSKKGKDMLKVVCQIYHGARRPQLTAYIVNPETLWMLKKLAKAAGVPGFDEGTLNPQSLVGKSVMAVIRTKHDDSGTYDDQNNIASFKARGGDLAETPAAPADLAITEESVPF